MLWVDALRLQPEKLRSGLDYHLPLRTFVRLPSRVRWRNTHQRHTDKQPDWLRDSQLGEYTPPGGDLSLQVGSRALAEHPPTPGIIIRFINRSAVYFHHYAQANVTFPVVTGMARNSRVFFGRLRLSLATFDVFPVSCTGSDIKSMIFISVVE